MTPINREHAIRDYELFRDGGAFESIMPASAEPLPELMDEPWPLRDILAKLVEAADILLDEKDYDGHGWEQIAGCRNMAKVILAQKADTR